MEKVKRCVKPGLVLLGVVLVYLGILLALAYTGVIGLRGIFIMNFIVMTIVLLVLGIRTGKKTSKKGYLEGLKVGGITVIVLLLVNLIFYRSFSLALFLYYLVLIASSTIGSILGINLKH